MTASPSFEAGQELRTWRAASERREGMDCASPGGEGVAVGGYHLPSDAATIRVPQTRRSPAAPICLPRTSNASRGGGRPEAPRLDRAEPPGAERPGRDHLATIGTALSRRALVALLLPGHAPAGHRGGGGPAGETLLIRRLLDGRGRLPLRSRERLVLEVPAGWVFCREGETGGDMCLPAGGGRERGQGRTGGGPAGAGRVLRGDGAFLLGQARTATVQAPAPCRCVLVRRKNFEALLREFPDLVQAMLVEMARRLRDHTERSLEAKEAEPGPQGGPDRPSR